MKKRKSSKRRYTYRKKGKKYRQIGKSKKSYDQRFSARKPGKRRSYRGNIYYEYRRNRSDIGKWL